MPIGAYEALLVCGGSIVHSSLMTSPGEKMILLSAN